MKLKFFILLLLVFGGNAYAYEDSFSKTQKDKIVDYEYWSNISAMYGKYVGTAEYCKTEPLKVNTIVEFYIKFVNAGQNYNEENVKLLASIFKQNREKSQHFGMGSGTCDEFSKDFQNFYVNILKGNVAKKTNPKDAKKMEIVRPTQKDKEPLPYKKGFMERIVDFFRNLFK